MLLTVNSIYSETLYQIAKNEHRLDIVVVSKMKILAKDMLSNENAEGLAEMHNTLVRLDAVIKKANDLYILGNDADK
jgi:hypothetical protein